MGRHQEWRKLVKKTRRKRIRSAKAQERDLIFQKEQEERQKLPGYAAWLSEQTALELFHRQEEERQRAEAQKKWEQEEKEAQKRWQEQQKKIADAKVEKAKQEALIREEWDREQKKKKENEERKKKEEEEKEKRQAEFLEQIDSYVNGIGSLPEGAVVGTETHPSELPCPFFSKVGACRFWDFCSRNHKRPGISKILLLPGFYSHFSLDHSSHFNKNEYDTDVSLEFNEEETYDHFLEFYEDVVSELKTYGNLVQFKVCCNAEPHLRGNVYAQYSDKRAALKAYRALQGRFYSGKQIKVEFSKIPSWKNAICGLFQGKRCPKGKNCNFLHVFRNPTSEFRNADKDIFPHRKEPKRSAERKHWRWSESPEPVSLPSVSKSNQRESGEKENKSKKKRRRESEDSNSRNRKKKSKEKRKDKSERRYTETESDCDTSNWSSEDSDYSKRSHRKSKRHKKREHSDSTDHNSKRSLDKTSTRNSNIEKEIENSVKDSKRKKRRKTKFSDEESSKRKGESSCEEPVGGEEIENHQKSRKKNED